MKVKATVSFSGTVTMAKDDIKDIKEGPVLNDLLKAGYVVKVEDSSDKTEETKDSSDKTEETKDSSDKKSAAKTKGGDSGEAK